MCTLMELEYNIFDLQFELVVCAGISLYCMQCHTSFHFKIWIEWSVFQQWIGQIEWFINWLKDGRHWWCVECIVCNSRYWICCFGCCSGLIIVQILSFGGRVSIVWCMMDFKNWPKIAYDIRMHLIFEINYYSTRKPESAQLE